MTDDDLALLGRLVAETNRRQTDALDAEAAAGRAIKANAAAADRRSQAVIALRELVAALTAGAGVDRRPDLTAARTAAQAILDPQETAS